MHSKSSFRNLRFVIYTIYKAPIITCETENVCYNVLKINISHISTWFILFGSYFRNKLLRKLYYDNLISIVSAKIERSDGLLYNPSQTHTHTHTRILLSIFAFVAELKTNCHISAKNY